MSRVRSRSPKKEIVVQEDSVGSSSQESTGFVWKDGKVEKKKVKIKSDASKVTSIVRKKHALVSYCGKGDAAKKDDRGYR